MKILIYSANYAPEPTGIGKYSGEMAEWLASQGHDVRVVAAPPHYPAWEVDPAYRSPLYRIERLNGVAVWRSPLWVPKNPQGFRRILHLLSFAISSAPVVLWQLQWRPDVVLAVAPAMVCAPIGWVTARLSGAIAWLHIQDFEVDVACQMGQLNGRYIQRFAYWCERKLLQRFDKVSSISLKMVEKLKSKGVSSDAIESFPNWVSIKDVVPLNRVSEYRQDLGIRTDQFVALFSGTWGVKQNLLLIPEAAKLLAHRDDIVFVVCGDGVMRAQLEQASRGLANVKLLPLQPLERLNELLGLADVHLLTQSAEAEDLVLPSKLTGMLSSGRPVIATCRPETEIATVLTQCGYIVEPSSAIELAQAIEKLADSPMERVQMGQCARKYAELHLGKDAILQGWVSRLYTGKTHAA